MWYRLEQATNNLQLAIHNLDSRQWIIVSVIAIATGVVFLRGFGSRTSY